MGEAQYNFAFHSYIVICVLLGKLMRICKFLEKGIFSDCQIQVLCGLYAPSELFFFSVRH